MQPQQPYQSPMQPAPVKKKVTARSVIFALMVSFGVLLLIGAAAWMYLLTRQSSDNGKTVEGAAMVLEPIEAAPKMIEVTSKLGMSLTYNARELAAFGFADDVTYSASDITETRSYSVLRVRPVETSQATRNEVALESPELRITSSLDKEYWSQFSDKKDYKELSKVDQLVKQTVDQRTTVKGVKASDTSVVQVGDNEYRKVNFTHKNEDLGITTTQQENCYIAVAHDRPQVACISNIRSGNFAVVPQLEQVLATIKYAPAKSDVLIDKSDDAKKADEKMLNDTADEDISDKLDEVSATEADDDKAGAESSMKQTHATSSKYLKNSKDFSVFLKAAPATVRVGTIYCADIKLTLPDGSGGPQLTGACVDKGSTGFFISNDGLLSTSASAVQVRPQDAIRSYIVDAQGTDQMYDRLERVLDYLVNGRMLMGSDAESILAGVQERNQDVIDKVTNLADLIAVENITISKESYKYALQLSDRPIVVSSQGDGSRTFAYSDSVIEAELEAKDYSGKKTQTQIQNGDVVAQDTALLRAKKQGAYPSLKFAESSNVSKGATVNVIGMPLYAAGSLESAQLRSTPLLRQGEADEVLGGANSQRLLAIKTPSHAGLAGAPALSDSAQVVGVGTFANLSCPGNKCFGGMLLRDTVDIRSLVRDRNLTLHSLGPIRESWNRAVDELIRGNYEKSYKLFNNSAALYPQNYLSTPYANFAKSQIGSSRDTSSFNTWLSVAQIIVAISAILLVVLLIAQLALKLFTKPYMATQYGQLAGNEQISPQQWQPSPVQSVAVAQQQPWQPPQQSNPPPYSYGPAQSQSQPAPNRPQEVQPYPPATRPQEQSTYPPQQPPNQPL